MAHLYQASENHPRSNAHTEYAKIQLSNQCILPEIITAINKPMQNQSTVHIAESI